MSLYLGLMSGTSMDAIDVALVDCDATPLRTVFTRAVPYDASLKRRISALIDTPERVSMDEFGQMDVAVARAFASAVNDALRDAGVGSDAVAAIGSHGQTVRHRPDLSPPFSLQIGDPNTLSEMTGITVVADFRRRDVAAGGQGAPLVPFFHDQAFRCAHEERVILNLGGIANVTLLRAGSPVLGFDTGPGNRLLDAWITRHLGIDFDRGGAWARTGTVNTPLLQRLLDEPYLKLPPPKSTGRELFNLTWLDDKLSASRVSPQDVQATLLEFTAMTVAAAVDRYAPGAAWYVCGGGAHNGDLLDALRRRVAPARVATTAALGLDPDYVEAVAFAWFAARTLGGLTSSAASVTGARGARILGGVYRYD